RCECPNLAQENAGPSGSSLPADGARGGQSSVPAAEKTQRTRKSSPRRQASQTSRGLSGRTPLRAPSQSPAPAAAFPFAQRSASSVSFKSRMIVLRFSSVFSSSSSSKIGSDTIYFSLDQLPRSIVLQRSLQKGKSLSFSESVAFLQMGQR